MVTQKRKDYLKKHYIEHKQALLDYQKQYYAEHKKDYHDYYQSNSNGKIEYQRQYYEKNKDEIINQQLLRNDKKRLNKEKDWILIKKRLNESGNGINYYNTIDVDAGKDITNDIQELINDLTKLGKTEIEIKNMVEKYKKSLK
jgi:hypothetical protein